MFVVSWFLIGLFVLGAVYFVCYELVKNKDLPVGWDGHNEVSLRRYSLGRQGLSPFEATMLELSEMTDDKFSSEQMRLEKISEFACQKTYGVSLEEAKSICLIVKSLKSFDKSNLQDLALSRFNSLHADSYDGAVPEVLKSLTTLNWAVVYKCIIPKLFG